MDRKRSDRKKVGLNGEFGLDTNCTKIMEEGKLGKKNTYFRYIVWDNI